MDLNDFMTAPAAALEANIPIKALYKRISRGTIPCERVGNRTILIPKRVVETLKRDKRYKDGRKKNPLYSTYMNIIRRCYNPKDRNYENYGGKGISVCKKWLDDFNCFCEDIGERPKGRYILERKDPLGGYDPDNCHWVSRSHKISK